MQRQNRQQENVLFSASPHANQPAESGGPSNHLIAPIKRPLSIFIKPNRSARLGAAAAAAAAACPDCNDNDDSSTEQVLEEVLLSPLPNGSGGDAAEAEKLLQSLLGSMPALPGSPTLETPDVALPRSRAAAALSPWLSFRGRRSSAERSGGTFSGCGPLDPTHPLTSPGCGRALAKCHSERGVAGGGGAAASVAAAVGPVSDSLRTPTTSAVLRTLHMSIPRRSVDAAENAETLATRHASEMSMAGAAEAAAAASQQRAALAAAVDAAAARAHTSAAAAAASAAAAAAGSPYPRSGPHSSPTAHKFAAAAAASPGPIVRCRTSLHQVRPLQSTEGQQPRVRFDTAASWPRNHTTSSSEPSSFARSQTGAGTGTGAAEGPEGVGTGPFVGDVPPQRRASEGRLRPRWVQKLLRLFRSEEASKPDGNIGDEAANSTGSRGGGGGVDGGVGGGGGDGDACGANVRAAKEKFTLVVDKNSGRKRMYGSSSEGDPGSSRRTNSSGLGSGILVGGGPGYGTEPGEESAAGGDSSSAASSFRGHHRALNSRSGRDPFSAASRLLSSRLSHRSRQDADEQRPLSVMGSRDSTTLHRARLASRGTLGSPSATLGAEAATAARQTSAYDTCTAQRRGRGDGDDDDDAVATVTTVAQDDTAGCVPISTAGTAEAVEAAGQVQAPVAGVSVTAVAQAVGTAIVVPDSSDFAGTVELQELGSGQFAVAVPRCSPAKQPDASFVSASRSAESRGASRPRQRSAPGAARVGSRDPLEFTRLSAICSTCSQDVTTGQMPTGAVVVVAATGAVAAGGAARARPGGSDDGVLRLASRTNAAVGPLARQL